MLIVILWWASIIADFLLSLHLLQASIGGERRFAFFLGIALMFSGIALRQYSIVVLGKYFTFDVAVHNGQSLIESGPYRSLLIDVRNLNRRIRPDLKNKPEERSKGTGTDITKPCLAIGCSEASVANYFFSLELFFAAQLQDGRFVIEW